MVKMKHSENYFFQKTNEAIKEMRDKTRYQNESDRLFDLEAKLETTNVLFDLLCEEVDSLKSQLRKLTESMS